MIKQEDIIGIGKFQKTHALKGELNMISEMDPEYFIEGNPLIIEYEGILVPYFVESIRPKGSTSYLIKLEGIDTETDASQFVNKEIHILKKDAEEWLDDELKDSNDLIGYKIIDFETGSVIGIIERIEDSTENLLFLVTDDNNSEIYIPATDDFIVEIDDEVQEIKMNLPSGLIDLNKKE